MARNSWNVLTLLVALMLSGSYFTWGQLPGTGESRTQESSGTGADLPSGAGVAANSNTVLSSGFPAQAMPGRLVPQSPVSGGGVGPNYPQVAAAGNGELLMTTSLLADGRQQVVVTDTKTKTMAIYEVEPVTGKVLLRSVREIRWDLQMQQFNATSPTPGEIRSMTGLK
jgi:hypothetical protein